MDLIINCSGSYPTVNGRLLVAAFGLTVRQGNRLIYRESGVFALGKDESAWSARNVAVWKALIWVQIQPLALETTVIVRFDEAGGGEIPVAVAMLLARVREHGWKVWLQPVAPEYVSEAVALSRRAPRSSQMELQWQSEAAVTTALLPYGLSEGVTSSSVPNGLDADLTVICDGGHKPFSGSSGVAVYACLVWHCCELVYRESGVVCLSPTASSQVAELGAVVAALRWLVASSQSCGARVEIRSDCRWVVNTMISRSFGHARRGLTMLLRAAGRHLARLDRNHCHVIFSHVPRAVVAEADALCWRVYGQQRAQSGSSYAVKSFLVTGGMRTRRMLVGQ